MKKIVYLGGPIGLAEVRAIAEPHYEVTDCKQDQGLLSVELSDCDALVDASMRVQITESMLDAARCIKIISTATTGADHISIDGVTKNGVLLCTLKDSSDQNFLRGITPAAELTWTILMALARNLIGAVEHVREGEWIRENFPGTMLKGKTIGIIGCGRIGQWVARYANAFGMEIYGYDPYLEEFPEGIQEIDLNNLAKLSDFISIHVHLNDETRGLVGPGVLDLVKPKTIIVNSSRGAIVDETALLLKLEKGLVGGYGADVLDGEPWIENHPLVSYSREHNNVILTPHCGGFSPDVVRLVCRRATDKVLSYFDNCS